MTIFLSKTEEVEPGEENCIMKSYTIKKILM
jgi:hypothetical protein